jgi:hypothetical protein
MAQRVSAGRGTVTTIAIGVLLFASAAQPGATPRTNSSRAALRGVALQGVSQSNHKNITAASTADGGKKCTAELNRPGTDAVGFLVNPGGAYGIDTSGAGLPECTCSLDARADPNARRAFELALLTPMAKMTWAVDKSQHCVDVSFVSFRSH